MHPFPGSICCRLRSSCCALLLLQAASGFAAEAVPATSGGLLLVANKTDQTLSIIDPDSGRLLANVSVDGNTGHEVAASPDGKRAFVPIFGNSGVGRPGTDGQVIRVIDLEQYKLIDTIDLGRGLRPHEALFGPRNGLLYVTTENDNSVTVIDPKALKVIGRITTNQEESHMLAISRDGRRGYTANVGPGTVSVLDLEAKRTIAIIPVAPVVQRICLSADDRRVFTADQTQPRLAVIDTANNKLDRWIELPGKGYGAAATPDGRWLVIALIGLSKVGIIDLETMRVARTIDVPRAPQEVLIPPDGHAGYVSCDRSGQVAVIDLKEWKVEKLLEAGRGADGLAWAVRP